MTTKLRALYAPPAGKRARAGHAALGPDEERDVLQPPALPRRRKVLSIWPVVYELPVAARLDLRRSPLQADPRHLQAGSSGPVSGRARARSTASSSAAAPSSCADRHAASGSVTGMHRYRTPPFAVAGSIAAVGVATLARVRAASSRSDPQPGRPLRPGGPRNRGASGVSATPFPSRWSRCSRSTSSSSRRCGRSRSPTDETGPRSSSTS